MTTRIRKREDSPHPSRRTIQAVRLQSALLRSKKLGGADIEDSGGNLTSTSRKSANISSESSSSEEQSQISKCQHQPCGTSQVNGSECDMDKQQKGLNEDTTQESSDVEYHFGEAFFPGEEEALAIRGELLPEELMNIKTWISDEKISTVRECAVHPSSKRGIYDNGTRASSSNAIYSGGHGNPIALIDVDELIQDDHQLIENKKNEQCLLDKKAAEYLAQREEEDEYYYEDHLDLVTDNDACMQKMQNWHTKLSISTKTVWSLTSVLSSLIAGGSSWELLSQQDSFLSVSFSNELQEESVASNEKLRAIRKARVRKILNDRGLNQVVKAFDSNSVKDQLYYYCGEDLTARKKIVLEKIRGYSTDTLSHLEERNYLKPTYKSASEVTSSKQDCCDRSRDTGTPEPLSAKLSIPSTSYSISRTDLDTGDNMEWEYWFPDIGTPWTSSMADEKIACPPFDSFMEPNLFVTNTYYSADTTDYDHTHLDNMTADSEHTTSSTHTDSYVSCNSSRSIESSSLWSEIWNYVNKVISKFSLHMNDFKPPVCESDELPYNHTTHCKSLAARSIQSRVQSEDECTESEEGTDELEMLSCVL